MLVATGRRAAARPATAHAARRRRRIAFNLREHSRRLIAECLRLGALDELADLRLIQWAHMLGFRGHFSTRSRHYSTTLGDIRADRTAYARDEAITTGRLPLVIAEWEYAGKGYSLGDALLAAALTGTALSASPTSGGGDVR
ncbi:replication initiator [Streptosporangium sp. NPDC001681]|uniref:replication initiator n=1 Tax=Streptosporangium sp. NPDC001681 TaxID=3154395 RepID=UPI00332C6C3C